MKFLKQKNISKFSITDQTLFANHYGRAVMNLTGAVRLPKGTTAQRPDLSLVRTLGGADGFIRYNTDTDTIEALVDDVWEVVRAPGATAITKQTLGPGDGEETVFGPLVKIPASANNIIVLVENVFQISDTNFVLVQNPAGKAPGWYLDFSEAVPTDKNVTVLYGYAN
jgi:hypothetical protein